MPNTYDIGDQVRLTVVFKSGSVATDPTAITLRIKEPGIAAVTYTYPTGIVKDSVGNYHYLFTCARADTHSYNWTGTGTVISAAEKTFEVSDSAFD